MLYNFNKNSGSIFKISAANLVGDSFFKTNAEVIRELAEESQQHHRTKLKAMGYTLQENKIPKNKIPSNGDDTINLNNDEGNSSNLGIESHPLLPYTGGKPADNILLPGITDLDQADLAKLPESVREDLKKNEKRKKEKIENELRLKNKLRARPTSAPRQRPRVAAPAPRSRPLPRPRPI